MMNSLQTLKIKNKQYELLKVLGQGSFGKVYLAQIKGDTNQYAVKEQNQITDEEWKFCEFLVTKKFKNLVNLFTIEKLNKKIYMVMEYCQISLYDKIQQKTFDASQMRFVMKEIANGIKELHDMGLAHRDLKPENVLIQVIQLFQGQVQERYKICDFGTVKEKDRLQTKQVGTPYYLAPEQLDGNENYTLKADVWSFGALCFELLTNKPLFDGMTVQEIERKIRTLNIDQEIDKLKNMERHHYDLFKKMLNRNPHDRCDIYYVIANLGETIRTKSINRVDTKIEISKKQQANQTMQSNQQKQLAAVGSFQQTMQPVSQHPSVVKPQIQTLQNAEPLSKLQEGIKQKNADQTSNNISNNDRKTQHIANYQLNYTLQKPQHGQFVPPQLNEQNQTLNHPINQDISTNQHNFHQQTTSSQFVVRQQISQNITQDCSIKQDIQKNQQSFQHNPPQQNFNQEPPVNQDVKINEQQSQQQPTAPQSQQIQSNYYQQPIFFNQFNTPQQNSQNLPYNQSMKMDSQNQQNFKEFKPSQQNFQEQPQKVSEHLRRDSGGIDQSAVQIQEQNKKKIYANIAQFSNQNQNNPPQKQDQKPPLNNQIKQIVMNDSAQPIQFAKVQAPAIQSSQGSAQRGRAMDFKQDNITPVQKNLFMSPQEKNPYFKQNLIFKPQ